MGDKGEAPIPADDRSRRSGGGQPGGEEGWTLEDLLANVQASPPPGLDADDPRAGEFDLPEAPVGEEDRQLRKRLLAEIARLERDLGTSTASSFPYEAEITRSEYGGTSARSLSTPELELIREDLAAQLHWVRDGVSVRSEMQEQSRRELEEMIEEPGRHRGRRVSQRQLGEPGTGVYHVTPRHGLIGRIAGWWRVKLSGSH